MFTRLAAAMVAAAATLTLIPATPAAADTAPPRVMLLGDSVTQGSDGEFTWRYFAGTALGASVDFVGPYQGTHAGPDAVWSGGYADPAFDQDHAARWGLSVWETLYAPSETAPTIEHLMGAHAPDVLVLTLGYNDLTWLGQTPATLSADVERLLTRARAVVPGVDVVLGGIPQTWITGAADYNALLPGMAAAWTTPESRVVAAAVPTFVNGDDTYDPAHPTTMGQRKIASALVGALDALGVPHTPQPTPHAPLVPPAPPVTVAPTTPAPTVAPNRPRRVRAVRRGRVVRVTWRRVADAERYVVRCGRPARVTTARRVKVRTLAKRCRVRAVNDAGSSSWKPVRVRARRA